MAARHISAVAEGPHPIADDAEKADAVMRYARSLRSKSECTRCVVSSAGGCAPISCLNNEERMLTSLLPSVVPADWLELAGDVGCAEGNVVTALVAAKLLLPAKLQPSECWRL